MSIYQSDPNRAPDSDYEPGLIDHIVPGNRARQLDWRRTPMTVVDVRPDVGFCTMRLDAFEDAGALWDIPFERIHHYQFERDGSRASADEVATIRTAIERFDRPLEIECERSARVATDQLLETETVEAERWLSSASRFVAAGDGLPDPELRIGVRALFDDLEDYLTLREVADIEADFTRHFVSNPFAGEVVIGHRIVLAELGLVPYSGSIVRDPLTFEGAWTRDRRSQHLVVRIGFTRALFRHLRQTHVTLYRGFTAHGPVEPPRNHTFVSASFSSTVAWSHLHDPSGVLLEQQVPVERLLMTYLETPAMNEAFKEAEAILFFEPDTDAF